MPHFPFIQLLAALGAISFTFVIFRLNSFNTFVDHRKTTLRGVFREVCEAYPDLLFLIQNIGKTKSPGTELSILGRIHPVARYLAEEIHRFRQRYNRLLLLLLIVIFALTAGAVGIAISDQGSFWWPMLFGVLIMVWMLFVWKSLRLDLAKDLLAAELEEMLERLAPDCGDIAKTRGGSPTQTP